jgi:hypothetical protein
MYNLQIVRLMLVKRYKILYGNPFGRASPKNGGGTPWTSSTKEIFEITLFLDEHKLCHCQCQPRCIQPGSEETQTPPQPAY